MTALSLIEATSAGTRLTIKGRPPVFAPGSEPKSVARTQVRTAQNAWTFTLPTTPAEPLALAAFGAAQMEHVPLFVEHSEYDLYVLGPPDTTLQSDAPGTISRLSTFTQQGNAELTHYRLSFGSEVGLLSLRVGQASRPDMSLTFEVFPRKLSYHDDYADIVADISSMSSNLVFDLLAKTHAAAVRDDSRPGATFEWLAVARRLFSHLVEAIRRIARDPHRAFEKTNTPVRIDRARRFRPAEFLRATTRVRGDHVTTSTGLALPRRVLQQSQRTTFNTPPNRALRWILRELDARARLAEAQFKSGADDEARRNEEHREHWLKLIRQIRVETAACAGLDFLAAAAPEAPEGYSPVLEWHPLYAKAYRLGLALLRGISPEYSGDVHVGAKTMWLLYEYWCVLALTDILASHTELEQTSALQIAGLQTKVVLRKGVQAAATFRIAQSQERISLYYNRFFDTPSVPQQPDIILSMPERGETHLFDAKYRLDWSTDYVKQYGAPGPMAPRANNW